MKCAFLSFLGVLALTCLAPLHGQSPRLANFRYIPDPPPAVVFDVQAIMEELQPIELLTEPLRFPEHLMYRAEDLPWLKLLQEAQQLGARNETQAAYDLLGRFLEQYPDFQPARLHRADMSFRLGRYSEAEHLYTSLLRQEPDHFQTLNNLAWLYLHADDPDFRRPDKALLLSRRAVNSQPMFHHGWSTLSHALFANLHFEEAQKAIDQALQFAQQSGEPAQLLIHYLNHAEKCRRAHRATSLME